MASGLDNLSAEGLSQLSKTINEAKELLAAQEELLRRTLAIEQQIITRRVAGLKEYKDAYSKLLNGIATEQASLSEAMFKITEAGKEAAANAERAAKSASSGSGNGGSSGGSGGSGGGGVPKNETIDDEQSKALDNYNTSKNIAERLKKQKTLDDQVQSTLKKEKDAVISIEQLRAAYGTAREKHAEEFAEKEKALEHTLTELTIARLQEKANKEQQMRDVQITHLQEMANAELDAQNLKNKFQAELAYASSPEAADVQKRHLDAIADAEALNALQQELDREREEFIFQNRLKNNGELNAAELAAFNEQLALRYDSEEALQKWIAEYQKKQLDEEIARRKKEEKDQRDANKKEDREKARAGLAKSKYGKITAMSPESFKDYNVKERLEDLRDMRDERMQELMEQGYDEKTAKLSANIEALGNTLSSLSQELEKKIDEIAGMKGAIDTRLQGSNNDKDYLGSYWNRITKDIISVGAVNPFFKQEAFANKIKELVDSGIAFDLEQRAFLATISDKIATTFNVADGTLLRLIRIQQQDSTAGRLGMESALNTFLNSMYENTEYLKGVADSVRGSLEEMQALMEGAAATEVEYQVQKWMGSLYSVGMSQTAVNSITNALGQIAAGQIEGLTGDGAGNLLIMAANNAGVPIADILAKGLDADKTNELLQATVNYLAELAESSKDNQVVQQQLANVFGVKASDLRAATNLTSQDSVGTIFSESMSYDNMLRQLYKMAATMGLRTSVGEMLTNVWDNVNYTLAGSMASSPISYLIYKMAGLVESVTGGVDIGLPMVMGNGLPVQFKLSDLMRAGAMLTGALGTLPQMINGLVTSTNGALMLASMGIDFGSGLKVTPRGNSSGLGALGGGGTKTTSGSAYVGNANSSDIKDSTIQQNEDSVNQQVVEAQENAEETQIDTINTTVLKIYELLDDVAHGNSYFRVKVEGYGLTKAGASGGSIGGVNALDSLNNGGSNSLTSLSSSGGSVNSSSLGGSVNFGGWTTSI
jgi:hypothetical protein